MSSSTEQGAGWLLLFLLSLLVYNVGIAWPDVPEPEQCQLAGYPNARDDQGRHSFTYWRECK